MDSVVGHVFPCAALRLFPGCIPFGFRVFIHISLALTWLLLADKDANFHRETAGFKTCERYALYFKIKAGGGAVKEQNSHKKCANTSRDSSSC